MSGYFEGWYYKQQAEGKTLALVPGRSNDGAFIQVITDEKSFQISFDLSEYSARNGCVNIGGNLFSVAGIKLNVSRKDISLQGELNFANLTPIRGDIMGPFRFFPMECRHEVISMKHDVTGEIFLNGERFNFQKGIGYIEADRGRSFPESYAWVHAGDSVKNYSVMVSVAKIPFAGFHFQGCICVVWLDGKEYRLATYKGAKILRCERGVIELAQGKYRLTVSIEQRNAHDLAAPQRGEMSRIIRESASCSVRILFTCDGKVVLSAENKCGSYEFE